MNLSPTFAIGPAIMATTTSADEFCQRHFDFIVVGGGTAGLVIAARLAENPAITVGVLEAGGVAVGEDGIDIPGCFGQTLGGPYDWQFETVAQDGLGGRVLPWPRGKLLGGTSALNFMTWNRASRDDYDAWEELGNAGWGWESILLVVIPTSLASFPRVSCFLAITWAFAPTLPQ
jgi:choline dehydrogenase-like flavoprotein